MIDTQAIRNKILDLAMRGQLTEQLPEDGTAEDLYQQIQVEKQCLIKAGKVKKEKTMPDIPADEIPFPIPSNWKWVRIGSVLTLQSGKNIAASAIKNEPDDVHKIPCYGGNGQRGFVSQPNIEGFHAIIGRQGALCGNINFAEGPFYATEHAVVVYEYAGTDMNWAGLTLRYLNLNQYATSVAQPGLAVNKIDKVLMPIPPIAEQQRIVEKIDQAFSLLDTIDVLQAQYADNRTVLKAKLIDAAIQGKLTEQMPEDGTAEELYERIQAEKQALIKAGKIKKEKPLPEIKNEETPFEIPKNWKWVRFSDLYSLSNGVSSRGTPGGIPHPVLRLADLVNGHISTDSIREIDLSDDEFSGHKVQKGDLVFIRVNGSRDKVATAFLYQGEADISYCDHLFCGHKISNLFDASFVMPVYHSAMAKAQIDPEIKTTAGQNTINQKSMGKIMIPLPPLAEQKRIVARLEEIMSVF